MKIDAPVKDGKRVGGIPVDYIPSKKIPVPEQVMPQVSNLMGIDRARALENERIRQMNRPDTPTNTATKVLMLENDIQNLKEKLQEKEDEIETLKGKSANIEKYLKKKDKDFIVEVLK